MLQQSIGINKDAGKAAYWFSRAIAGGNSSAMTNLGTMYIKGTDIEADTIKGLELLERGAGLGNIAALYNLAYMNLMGTAVEKNLKKGFDYAVRAVNAVPKEAIEKDDERTLRNKNSILADAEFLVAACYDDGVGTQPDKALALKYLNLSASHGNTKACMILADMYDNGIGVEKNSEKARELRERAAGDGLK